jgi:hypothetical protein
LKGCAVLSTLHCRRTLTLIAALLLCACSKDDNTGKDLSEDDTSVLPQCQVDERALGMDEATPIGAPASELFRWIAGAHTEPLTWLSPHAEEDSYAQLAGFGPEQGSSQLRLDFEPIGARLLTRVPLNEDSANRCLSSLALDVNLHLSTSGGALDEQVQTTLEATRADFASLQPVYLPIDSLQGAFTAQISVEPGYDYSQSPQLWLSLLLSEAGATGKLVLVTRVNNGRAEFGSIPKIANFPGDSDLCQDGMYLAAADQMVDGASRDAVLQQLNGASPALTDDGQTQMQLEYTGVGGRACVQPGATGGSSTLSFPGTVRVHSSDGRVDGSIQTTLSGDASSGTLHSSASASSELSDRASATATASSYAIVDPIDFSGFDGGSFAFQTDVTVATDSGSLIVDGITAAHCLVTTYSGLCTGPSRTELWGTRWSQR